MCISVWRVRCKPVLHPADSTRISDGFASLMEHHVANRTYFISEKAGTHRKHASNYAVYGNEALKERQCQNWFAKFRFGNFSLKNAQQSGRPVEVDETHIKAIIDSNRHSTTREIAENLNVSHTCIKKNLRQLGYVKKLDLWVPHQLKEINMIQRISICDLLRKRNEIDPFLKRLITDNQKWVMQDESVQTTPKVEIHQKRLCCQFGGIIQEFCTLKPGNQMINSNV
ncbi:histone-lysine N-methyltransferase SETMAR-like [Bombus impatiens]|uniref:Histone-lysine N-methyltransferase SETMAR-like n=1 Tax=Bombus impatiens TaxID=132113 RepID=A0A6P8LH46_BOMIM|nr:histone-lysine N-methyltransferase SETMAR-like [Bombus impatiens]